MRLPSGGFGVRVNRERIRRSKRSFAVVALMGVALTLVPALPAHAAVPVVVNSAGSNWIETFASEDDGNRFVSVSFVVRHDPGRRITGVVRDTDFNGTDNTATLGATSITAQYLGAPGTNRLASSVVRHTFQPPEPGFSCGFLSGTRRVDVPLRFRVVDDLGQRSGSLSQNWHVIEDEQCTGVDDYPVLESVGQGATSATPGQSVSFSFVCDDADVAGSNDRCDFVSWRWRRLNDGVTSGETVNDAEDNTSRSFSTSFPTRGIYVVEARLCSEDACQDGAFWRLGSVQVNEAAAPTGSMSFSGAGVVAGSPPSVNQGDAATAVASITSTGGGTNNAVQVIEWDATNDGTFERTEFTTPQLSGSTVVQSPVSGAQLQQAISTSTFGLKTVGARLFDNGAIDAADDQRRSSVFTGQIRVNARPIASNTSATTPENTAVGIPLPATDPDNQPAPLSYEIVSTPANGSVSVSGSTAMYTPDPGFSGTDTFTFRAKDGPVPNAAWAFSNTATVTVVVTAVNDAPTAMNDAYSTNEDTTLTVPAPGVLSNDTDPEGSALTAVLVSGPSDGTLTLNADGSFTYTPNANFFGSDSFTYKANDGELDSNVATVTLTIIPVNDPPVCPNGAGSTPEGSAFSSSVTCADVEGDALTYSVVSGPSSGSLAFNPDGTFTFTPAFSFTGTVSFTYKANDGADDSNVATFTITVTDVVPPPPVVTKTANPSSVPAPGGIGVGQVDYTVTVTNPSSAVEPVTITALTDSSFGNLNGQGTCSTGSTLQPGQTYSCTFTGVVSGSAGSTHTNTVTATVKDDENNAVSGSGSATVTVVTPTAKVSPQFTTCQQYKGGSAADLNEIRYVVQDGKISAVSSQFFYFSKIIASTANFTLDIKQTRDNAGIPLFGVQASQTKLYTSLCTVSPKGAITIAPDGSNVKIAITGALPGEVFFVAIMYNPTTVVGTPVSQPYPSSIYRFATHNNGVLIPSSRESVLLKPQ